jgi:outer membrane receptor protein involved in Fe transport
MNGPVRAVLLLAAFASAAASADDEGLSADRPDFVNGPDVMGPGRVQLEAGFIRQREHDGDTVVRTRSVPWLLRVGVGHDLELSVGGAGPVREQASGSDPVEGWSDLSLGLKIHWRDGDEHGRPAIGALVQATLPTGAAPEHGRGVRPALYGLVQWDFGQGWSLGVMPGLIADTDDAGRRYAAGALAASLGKDFDGGLHGFVEIAGQHLASAAHGGSLLTFDTGVAWRVTPDLQLDFAVSKGLNSDSPDWQWGLGGALRF